MSLGDIFITLLSLLGVLFSVFLVYYFVIYAAAGVMYAYREMTSTDARDGTPLAPCGHHHYGACGGHCDD